MSEERDEVENGGGTRRTDRWFEPVAASLATGLLALVFATFEASPASGLEIRRLGFLAAVAVLGLGLAGLRGLFLSGPALLSAVALLTLPAGTRGFVVTALLAALLAGRFARLGTSQRSRPDLVTVLGLLLAAQVLLRCGPLLESLWSTGATADDPSTLIPGSTILGWVRLAVLPVLAAFATHGLVRARGGAFGLGCTLVAMLGGPGATPHTTLALWVGLALIRAWDLRSAGAIGGARLLAVLAAAGAAATFALPVRGPWQWLALPGVLAFVAVAVAGSIPSGPSAVVMRRAVTLLALWFVPVALLAGFPWLRTDPLRDFFRTAWAAASRWNETHRAPPGGGLPLEVSAERPQVGLDFDPASSARIVAGTIRGITFETVLFNGAELAPGTTVATWRALTGAGEEVARGALVAGVDTGEWAAARRDLASLEARGVPAPWRHSFTEDPSFLGQSYLAHFEWDEAATGAVSRVLVERSEALPQPVVLVLHRWAIDVAPPAGSLSLPLEPGDPFRAVLWTLPAVAILFALGRRDWKRTGASRAPEVRWVAASLAGLVLLVLGRSRLGLPGLDPALATGFVLVLAGLVAREIPRLRRALPDPLPRRPPAVFFLLPLAVYCALLPWTNAQRPPDGDEPYYLLIAHSLAYDFDADLANNYARGDSRAFVGRDLGPQLGDPVGVEGELYSRHNELLPLLLVVPYRLFGTAGALAAMAALAAALAWWTLRLARHYTEAHASAGPALLAWILLAFASPLLLFSGQVWVEVPAALLALIALDHLLDLRRDRQWSWRRWAGIAIPILLLPLLKLRFVLLAVPLLGLAWWRAGRPRRPLLAVAGLLAAVLAGAVAHNIIVFGNPLKIHSWEEINPQGFTVWNYLHGILGFFFDSAFGLFPYFPIWLILLPALAWLLRHRSSLLVDLIVVFGPYLVVAGRRREWFGGWSPPFRYALVALPLLAIALLPILKKRGRGARLLLASLATATLLLTVLWVAEPGWTYNFADGRTYLIDHLERRWSTDIGRFLPSSVRPRAALWWSIGVAVVLVPLVWSWRGAGSRWRRATRSLAPLLVALPLAALPFAAERAPTRVVELEDPWVTKRGGHLHPDLWTVDRPLYRGGWTLRGGEEAEAPIVAGGPRVHLSADVRYVRNTPAPITLEVRAGARTLATWTPDRPEVWHEVDLGVHPWPADGPPLVIAAVGPAAETPLAGLIVDRIRLEWRER